MARPKKEGLDYFPKDTTTFNDRKVRKLLKEFGCKGYVIFDYLLCVIYQDKGYYVQYDDELAFDVADYLGNGITENIVNEVVQGCVRYGLFDQRLFDLSNVLTSSGIQKRYRNAKRTGVIAEEMRVITVETPVNAEESTQSKVKESKVNGNTGNERKMSELKISDCSLPPDDIGYKVIEASIKIYDAFVKYLPDNKDLPLKKVSEWVPYIRELMEGKGYSYLDITTVAHWALTHESKPGKEFTWKNIILDAESLAKHFEKLKQQKKNGG